MIYRKPTFDDVEEIYNLINQYANEGVMLARSRNTLYETLREMIVADDNGTIAGVGGLHIVWDRMAEVRSMAVLPEKARQKIGTEIVKRLIEEAKELNAEKVFTLTYKPGFFQTLGFQVIVKEDLPPKVLKDCIDCPKFPNCDEIALIRKL